MEATEAADMISEAAEEKEHDQFRNRAAMMIAVIAAVLAISGLGDNNAKDEMVASNIKASDTWSFYQAKNVRQNLYALEIDDLKAQLDAGVPPAQRAAIEARLKSYEDRVARYESEPD